MTAPAFGLATSNPSKERKSSSVSPSLDHFAANAESWMSVNRIHSILEYDVSQIKSATADLATRRHAIIRYTDHGGIDGGWFFAAGGAAECAGCGVEGCAGGGHVVEQPDVLAG